MTPTLSRRLRAVATWPLSQRLLRMVVVLGPVVALLASGPAGQAPPPWLVPAVLVLSLGAAALPDSGTGTIAMLVVLVWWVRVPGDALHPIVLLAAGALLAAHVAALLVAAGPPETPVDGRVARLWLGRGAAVLLAAPVLWGLALVLRGGDAPEGLWIAGLVMVLLAATAAATAFPPAPQPQGRR